MEVVLAEECKAYFGWVTQFGQDQTSPAIWD